MKNSKRTKGLFITFEGGEGSGKTTLIESLASYFQEKGKEVVVTREPGGSSIGPEIRSMLLSLNEEAPLSHKAELLLFLADRAQHIQELILPSIREGRVVLCDRFNDSTIAYQGYGRGLDVDEVEKLCLLVSGNLLPDLTFLLDVDPALGLERTRRLQKEHSGSGSVDRIEGEELEFHQKLRKGFLAIAKKEAERVVTIDAKESKEAVLKEAVKALKDV